MACADVHLGKKARPFTKSLGIHFLLVMGTHTHTLSTDEEGGGNGGKKRKVLDSSLFESSLSPLVMKEALLLAVVDARPGVQVGRVGGWVGGYG